MVSCRSALNVDPRDFSFLILCGVYHGVLGFSVISPSAAVIGGLGLREQKIGVTVHASEEGGPTPDGCGGGLGACKARLASAPSSQPITLQDAGQVSHVRQPGTRPSRGTRVACFGAPQSPGCAVAGAFFPGAFRRSSMLRRNFGQ